MVAVAVATAGGTSAAEHHLPPSLLPISVDDGKGSKEEAVACAQARQRPSTPLVCKVHLTDHQCGLRHAVGKNGLVEAVQPPRSMPIEFISPRMDSALPGRYPRDEEEKYDQHQHRRHQALALPPCSVRSIQGNKHGTLPSMPPHTNCSSSMAPLFDCNKLHTSTSTTTVSEDAMISVTDEEPTSLLIDGAYLDIENICNVTVRLQMSATPRRDFHRVAFRA